MFNFLTMLSDERWSYSTLFLYIVIVISSSFFAWISQSRYKENNSFDLFVNKIFGTVKRIISGVLKPGVISKIRNLIFVINFKQKREDIDLGKHSKINFLPLFISFIILWFFSAFRSVGADYLTYKEIFNNANDKEYIQYHGIETGYVLLNKLIRIFTHNEFLFLAFISLITTLLVFCTIYYFSSKIHVGLAVLAYTSIFYFQSYNLTRIYLASAIVLFASRFLFQKQYGSYILLVLIASSIHTSSIVMFLPLFLVLLFGNNKKWIVGFLFIFVLTCFIFVDYLIYFNISDRYEKYLVDTNLGSIGLGQMVIHAPLVALFLYLRRFELNFKIIHIFFVFIASSFAISMLGYAVPMIGRLFAHFTLPFLIFIPFGVWQIRNEKEYKPVLVIAILYMVWRLFLYFSGYLFLDGIMPYDTIF
ncbi:hypothetical protein A8F94_10870 [Bacillus sp. FJAT-27225]|uniref:EpsG family protein n=1 Tax=Bacillus sp. FJAT-27225 TaxID=1743144 RepID=UPI00080C23F4|nr:EpsG family protein [Bacillus sp. FJAT-27225]OCA88292.1 hypothetical protein A8F94_10870 [Bacillus sp. FJAT-27225]